jgi:N6-L-threonylcarbamoyladenine synthase
MYTLGIESSCDETAASVVLETGKVLSNVVHTQFETHAPYGGVIPELASRDHLVNVERVVARALTEAGLNLEHIDLIAATARPGLVGALLVGLQVGKGLCWATGKPFVGVDHLVGHVLAVFLENNSPPPFPFAALLVSGGHTALYRVDGPHAAMIRALGATRDDAAGEAYDKVGKVLGFPYPGGPRVDALAKLGNASACAFTIPKVSELEFSFSGLKTQVANHIKNNGIPKDQALSDLCAGFQHAAVSALTAKTLLALKREQLSELVVGGGVAANSGLRSRLLTESGKHAFNVHFPAMKYCTDNAAMIAYAGAQAYLNGQRDPLSLVASSRTSLTQTTRKGRGLRSERNG